MCGLLASARAPLSVRSFCWSDSTVTLARFGDFASSAIPSEPIREKRRSSDVSDPSLLLASARTPRTRIREGQGRDPAEIERQNVARRGCGVWVLRVLLLDTVPLFFVCHRGAQMERREDPGVGLGEEPCKRLRGFLPERNAQGEYPAGL